MTSSNGNIFRVTVPLWGEFTGHRSPVNSPHKDQWRGALMLSLICAWGGGGVGGMTVGVGGGAVCGARIGNYTLHNQQCVRSDTYLRPTITCITVQTPTIRKEELSNTPRKWSSPSAHNIFWIKTEQATGPVVLVRATYHEKSSPRRRVSAKCVSNYQGGVSKTLMSS